MRKENNEETNLWFVRFASYLVLCLYAQSGCLFLFLFTWILLAVKRRNHVNSDFSVDVNGFSAVFTYFFSNSSILNYHIL